MSGQRTERDLYPLEAQILPHPPELFKQRGVKHHKIGMSRQTGAGLFSRSDLKSAAGAYVAQDTV